MHGPFEGMRVLVASAALAAVASAQFSPGDVFREYVWRPSSSWQRCTGTDASDAGARALLPNAINKLTIADLADAVRCEVVVEKLSSHAGTRSPRLRVNGNAWIPIPEPSLSEIPGSKGSGPPVEAYLRMGYPHVSVPLAQLKTGENKFEFDCSSGANAIGKTWPQFLIYGVTFRVYYDKTKKAAPDGVITSPREGSMLGDNPSFALSTTSKNVARVEFIGDYDDYDWRGDGKDRGWQYILKYGVVDKHISTDTSAPYQRTWDTLWVPTQRDPFRVVARVVDTSGLVYVTEAVDGLTLRRSTTVRKYVSWGVPQDWRTNKGRTQSCSATITEPFTKFAAARIFMTTWNGRAAAAISVNGQRIAYNTGKGYDLSYNSLPVNRSQLLSGRNTLSTKCNDPGHGIEVQWPGITLLARYNEPESWPQHVVFGEGCAGTNGVPTLSGRGLPKLGSTYHIDLANGHKNSVGVIFNGISRDMFGTFPLPFDFKPIGAANCNLYTSIEFIVIAVIDNDGKATQRYITPNNPAFLGNSLYAQFGVVDIAANQLGVTLSNAGRWTFGSW